MTNQLCHVEGRLASPALDQRDVSAPPKKRRSYRLASEIIQPQVDGYDQRQPAQSASYLAALLHRKRAETETFHADSSNSPPHKAMRKIRGHSCDTANVPTHEVELKKNIAWESFLHELYIRNKSPDVERVASPVAEGAPSDQGMNDRDGNTGSKGTAHQSDASYKARVGVQQTAYQWDQEGNTYSKSTDTAPSGGYGRQMEGGEVTQDGGKTEDLESGVQVDASCRDLGNKTNLAVQEAAMERQQVGDSVSGVARSAQLCVHEVRKTAVQVDRQATGGAACQARETLCCPLHCCSPESYAKVKNNQAGLTNAVSAGKEFTNDHLKDLNTAPVTIDSFANTRHILNTPYTAAQGTTADHHEMQQGCRERSLGRDALIKHLRESQKAKEGLHTNEATPSLPQSSLPSPLPVPPPLILADSALHPSFVGDNRPGPGFASTSHDLATVPTCPRGATAARPAWSTPDRSVAETSGRAVSSVSTVKHDAPSNTVIKEQLCGMATGSQHVFSSMAGYKPSDRNGSPCQPFMTNGNVQCELPSRYTRETGQVARNGSLTNNSTKSGIFDSFLAKLEACDKNKCKPETDKKTQRELSNFHRNNGCAGNSLNGMSSSLNSIVCNHRENGRNIQQVSLASMAEYFIEVALRKGTKFKAS